jgi:hypothetical protein
MINCFLNLAGRVLVTAFILLVVLPLVWMLTFPLILIASLFLPGSYKFNLIYGIWMVSKLWLKLGDISI